MHLHLKCGIRIPARESSCERMLRRQFNLAALKDFETTRSIMSRKVDAVVPSRCEAVLTKAQRAKVKSVLAKLGEEAAMKLNPSMHG